MAMSKWIKEGIVTELIPNDRDFKKLTWIPREFDGNLPVPSAEARRHANLSKLDPGHVMWWAHNGMQIHDSDWDLNMAYFSNQLDEPVPLIPPPPPVVSAPISMVSVTTQTAAVPTHSCGTSPANAQALLPSSMLTTSQIVPWTPPYPGSTRRSKHGQAKKPRRQMPFRAMRMHCPGDENSIPLYRPDDATPDLPPQRLRQATL